MPKQYETPEVLTFESQAWKEGGSVDQSVTLVRLLDFRTFRTLSELEAHNLKQGKKIADAIWWILPTPIVSVVVARLMETMFRDHPQTIPDNEQPKGGGNDAK